MKTRKLFIADVEHPWITWDKDLYVLQERSRNQPDDHMQFYSIELVATRWNADLFWINADAVDIRDEIFRGKEVFMFIEGIESNVEQANETGIDQIAFVVQTNPGSRPRSSDSVGHTCAVATGSVLSRVSTTFSSGRLPDRR